jgi:N-acetyl-anhydromuramyl-L-alanine amidase AmpD
MTTINESQTAKGYTPAALVPAAFGRKRTIDGIVIHHWGVFGQRHDDVVKFFVSGPGATSAHFVVSAGRIDCLVSPQDAAWHSGNAVGNATTIGIECHPEATDADYATVAELVRYLRDQYGALPLSPHRQWNATACPGIWDLPRIDRLAGSAAIAPQGTTTSEDDEMISKETQDWLKANLLNKADGAYMNSARDDQYAATAKALGQKLDKADGGYIVGQIAGIKPGATDTAAIADAVIAAVGKDVAAEVITALGQKLGAA